MAMKELDLSVVKTPNSSGWPPAGRHESALPPIPPPPFFFKTTLACTGRKTERYRKGASHVIFFFSSFRSESPSGLWLRTPTMYSWTRRRYLQTIYTLSDSSGVKERTEQMTLETCESSVWSQYRCHFFSQCYCCQPCFLLYYSISEWYQVFYVLWIYVCKEEMWGVSTGRCFIFVMKYTMLTFYPSRNYVCFFSCRVPVFNPVGNDAKM